MLRKVLLYLLIIIPFSGLLSGAYIYGYLQGSKEARNEEIVNRQNLLTQFVEILSQRKTETFRKEPTPPPSPTLRPLPPTKTPTSTSLPTWGGPEIWSAVNKKRQEYGVNALSQRDDLCTIASIRLNELLELGKLDGHEGFSKMPEKRPDLKWIFDKYSNIAEFLVSGAQSPEQAVSLWENTLAHKKLLTGGEYVWGCIYAQYGFGVAITAF